MVEDTAEMVALVADSVRQAGGRVLFIGATAANAYARPRSTEDVDALLILSTEGVLRLAPLLRKGGLLVDPRDLDDARREGGHATVHDPSTGLRVDVKFAETAEERAQFARGLRLRNGIVVSGLEDTIAHKLRFNRGQDLLDVMNMLEMSGDRLKEDRLRQIMEDLGVPFRRFQRLRRRVAGGRRSSSRVVRKA